MIIWACRKSPWANILCDIPLSRTCRKGIILGHFDDRKYVTFCGLLSTYANEMWSHPVVTYTRNPQRKMHILPCVPTKAFDRPQHGLIQRCNKSCLQFAYNSNGGEYYRSQKMFARTIMCAFIQHCQICFSKNTTIQCGCLVSLCEQMWCLGADSSSPPNPYQ